MTQASVLLLATAVLLLLAGRASGAQPTDQETAARAFVTALVKEDFAAATKNFDATMRNAMPADKLRATWKLIIGQVGAFKEQRTARSEKLENYHLVFVTCEFEKATLEAKVVFNVDKRIAGLFFVPPNRTMNYQAPAYVRRDAFQETDVKIGAGGWQLPGTLSLPIGDGPFPAVVLVHGSGPHDRDETIGANLPFRDLAWGLASQGVAVLRYDKRTRVHADKLVASGLPITIKEEVVDDALAAVDLLRKQRAIDSKRIFVLGHSLGAMLAPRIAAQDPDIAGLILLASPARPLEDLYLEQMTYVYSLEGPLSEEKKAELTKIKAEVERVKDPGLAPNTPASELPLGVPASYWLSLRGDLPPQAAAKLAQPLLVLQGERDYQVISKDLALWRKELATRKAAELKSYPKLNHLFMAGEGRSRPTEYETASHVEREVVDDIAAWVKKH
jgi:uncharacterized protein